MILLLPVAVLFISSRQCEDQAQVQIWCLTVTDLLHYDSEEHTPFNEAHLLKVVYFH